MLDLDALNVEEALTRSLKVASLSASPIAKRPSGSRRAALIDHSLDSVLEVGNIPRTDHRGGPFPVALEQLGIDVLSVLDLDHQGLGGSRDK